MHAVVNKPNPSFCVSVFFFFLKYRPLLLFVPPVRGALSAEKNAQLKTEMKQRMPREMSSPSPLCLLLLLMFPSSHTHALFFPLLRLRGTVLAACIHAPKTYTHRLGPARATRSCLTLTTVDAKRRSVDQNVGQCYSILMSLEPESSHSQYIR